jgi:hypothetical protein
MLRMADLALVLLWLLGIVTKHSMGGFVHVLLVLAVILFLINLVRGNSP